MSRIPEYKTIQLFIRRSQYQVKQFWKEVWPIKWELWKQPKVLAESVKIAPYVLKVVLTVSVITCVISLSTLMYGSYLVLTTDAASEGGYVQEAVVGSDLKIFNPVVEPNSSAESKINSLLYHPLYYVEYPDFAASSDAPVITPVLLASQPEWQDLDLPQLDQRYKVLRFTLRDDIFWSNGDAITVPDVVYSFERLKEPNGNSQFRSVFTSVSIQPVPGNSLQYDLISENPNPQLIYAANFSPISQDYYASQSTDRLLSDPKSFKPTVTSGFFTFTDGIIPNPYNPRGESIENPVRDSTNDVVRTVILDKNSVQNFENILIDQYIIHKADTVSSTGGENDHSLERLAQEGKVDLFTRSLSSGLGLTSSEIKDRLQLEQKIVPSNTYFNLYLNIQINDYFINQSLRKYVLCQFLGYSLNPAYSDHLTEVPLENRIVPIQLGVAAVPECGNVEQILDPDIYTIEIDERTGIKRVLLFGKPFVINLVGFPDSEPLLTDIQLFFRDIGIPAELVKDERLETFLEEKTYHAIFLPITFASRDPYAILGAGGRDISQIRLNNRIEQYNVEQNLNAYSLSNLTDTAAKDQLVNFFANEFVALNMFRSNIEINYSNRVFNLPDSVPDFVTFIPEIYTSAPVWYSEVRRKWVFTE